MNYTNMNPQEFKKALQTQKDAVLIDVRTPLEVAERMIPGAIVIDFLAGNFEKNIANFDKDKTYYIYCKSGNRSGKACQIMSEMGFDKLVNLAGGMLAWKH